MAFCKAGDPIESFPCRLHLTSPELMPEHISSKTSIMGPIPEQYMVICFTICFVQLRIALRICRIGLHRHTCIVPQGPPTGKGRAVLTTPNSLLRGQKRMNLLIIRLDYYLRRYILCRFKALRHLPATQA